MNRFTNKNLLSRKTLFFRRGTSIQNVKNILTIQDMPHPRSLPIFGTKIDFLLTGSGKKLHEYIDKRHQQLGSIFYEQLGGKTKLVFISDSTAIKSLFLNLEGKYPAHLLPDAWILYENLYGSKRGLLFMNGEEWLSNRRMMNTHLLKDDTENWMLKPIITTTKTFIQKWKNDANNGGFTPNLETDFYKFSTDVIIAVLLGDNSTLKMSKHSEMLLHIFSDSVKKIFQTTTNLYGLPVKVYQRLNLKPWRDFKECVDTSLLLAQKIVADMLHKTSDSNGLLKKLQEENLSEDIITRIVADFVIAAGDTTAHTLLWLLYLLSNRQDAIKDIRLKDQQYVKHVVNESMRLYPVAPFLTRILPKESVLYGYKLEKGTPIVASIYTSGRNEQYFSEADKFLPYRWDRSDQRRKNLENHTPSASLPFALGARSCIGKKLAMLQMTELIYQIANQFDLKCLNEKEVKAVTSQVLIPNESIKIAVSLRES